MMKLCNNKCDKSGMHGYRIFLWIVLVAIVVGAIWYCLCAKGDDIPTDGTLVDDMKNAKKRYMTAAKNTVEDCKEDIKKGFCDCKEDLSNSVEDLCCCKEDAMNAAQNCGEDVKDNLQACKGDAKNDGDSEA